MELVCHVEIHHSRRSRSEKVPGKIFPQSNGTFYFDENGKIESQMFTGHDPL